MRIAKTHDYRHSERIFIAMSIIATPVFCDSVILVLYMFDVCMIKANLDTQQSSMHDHRSETHNECLIVWTLRCDGVFMVSCCCSKLTALLCRQ